jgi:dipeptidyl aminopeptidase/acylaminoacyl peptidase
MSAAKKALFGSWKSPITSELIAAKTIGTLEPFFGLGEIALDGEDIYWLEIRPPEGGRHVVVRYAAGGLKSELTPLPFDAGNGVHEYGGGAFAVRDGAVYFSNFTDNLVYCQDPGRPPKAITSDSGLRYADFAIDDTRHRLICVREDHTVEGREPVNTLVSISLDGDDGSQVLISGNDFYSSPRLSPDSSQLSWLTWSHPNMPFDGNELWVGEFLPDGSVGKCQLVAGGADESIFQPEWSPDGTLYFVSDRSGWWNLYRWRNGETQALCEMEAEFGAPQWVFGLSLYAFESSDRIVCAYTRDGTWHLASLDTKRGHLEPIETPYTDIWSVRAAPGRAIFAAGSPTEPASIVQLDLDTNGFRVLHRSTDVKVDPAYVSLPQPIEFPTDHGLTAHAFYYPPKNPGYSAPADELPPLLVISHGGPTSATWTTLRLDIQYWTSRGIAVLDVNYGGSTGYGRAFRERLKGQWCIVDVADCLNGALYLVKQDLADENRLGIRGGSAGGTCTLCALAFHDVFAAGASYYGDSNLALSEEETHKFESRYFDSIIGPYPERRDLYDQRSPIYSAHRIKSPMIFFQGLDDEVVRPNQTELMVQALRDNKVPVAYIPFKGEGHGFKRAENIQRSLDAELYFYSKVFSFELPDPVKPVIIENL